jgi:hypothetical protein
MPDAAQPTKSFSMLQEAVDSYEARPLPDGRTEIRLLIPPRFTNLWLLKLSELRATDAELQPLAKPDGPDNTA